MYVKYSILVDKKYNCLWLPPSDKNTPFNEIKIHNLKIPQSYIYISGKTIIINIYF